MPIKVTYLEEAEVAEFKKIADDIGKALKKNRLVKEYGIDENTKGSTPYKHVEGIVVTSLVAGDFNQQRRIEVASFLPFEEKRLLINHEKPEKEAAIFEVVREVLMRYIQDESDGEAKRKIRIRLRGMLIGYYKDRYSEQELKRVKGYKDLVR